MRLSAEKISSCQKWSKRPLKFNFGWNSPGTQSLTISLMLYWKLSCLGGKMAPFELNTIRVLSIYLHKNSESIQKKSEIYLKESLNETQ